jgi:FAD:protein FMN transferase
MKLPESPHLRLFLRRLALGLGLVVFFAWLALRQPDSSDARLLQDEFYAMGTIVSISLYLDEDQDREAARTALRDAQRAVQDYARQWGAWDSGALGRINLALSAGEAAEIPDDMRALFARAAELRTASGGLFDVRIGRLVELWGFHDEAAFRTEPPPANAIAERLAELAHAPALDSAAGRYGPAPVRLDFGAIAKGDATDLFVESLRAAGYPNVIVNAGGNLRAAGRRGERAWRIGVRHPRPQAQHRVLATLDIDGDEAVITSGDYERWFDHGGRRYHHLLDPRSGEPASGLQAVTVVAGNGALADAASTALFIAGPDGWLETARGMGIDQAFVVDGNGRIRVTTALAGRIRFAEGTEIEEVSWESGP